MSNYKKLKFDGAQMDALLSLVEQGGSGGNGGGSEWRYFDVTASPNKTGAISFAQMVKIGTSIAPAGYVGSAPIEFITMIGIDCASVMVSEGQSTPLSAVAEMLTASMGCVEKTKEQFYSL